MTRIEKTKISFRYHNGTGQRPKYIESPTSVFLFCLTVPGVVLALKVSLFYTPKMILIIECQPHNKIASDGLIITSWLANIDHKCGSEVPSVEKQKGCILGCPQERAAKEDKPSCM